MISGRVDMGVIGATPFIIGAAKGEIEAIGLALYGSKTLARHVFHEYQVQAELYALALAKMLAIEAPHQHRRRYGGLLYCFMRGMGQAGQDDQRQPGVYYIRPSFDRLAELERALQDRDDYQ